MTRSTKICIGIILTGIAILVVIVPIHQRNVERNILRAEVSEKHEAAFGRPSLQFSALIISNCSFSVPSLVKSSKAKRDRVSINPKTKLPWTSDEITACLDAKEALKAKREKARAKLLTVNGCYELVSENLKVNASEAAIDDACQFSIEKIQKKGRVKLE